jgi:hypothetical protein
MLALLRAPKMSGSVSPPGYFRPHTFVKVVDDDFCHDFHGRSGARNAHLPGHKVADNERVDAACNSPTDGLCKGARVSLPALKQIHLSSTCRLNGAALVGIIGQEARRLDQLTNMSSDNVLPRL